MNEAIGNRKIDWARTWMPVLSLVRDQLLEEGCLRGRRIAAILPVEPKAACLAVMLAEAGAEVTVASTGAPVHDDVAAGLASRGVHVLTSPEEVLRMGPEVVIDDHARVLRLAHATHPEALADLVGAFEGTTTGVLALRALEADGTLKVPCIAADRPRCMSLVDGGSGQSTVLAVADATNLLVAGKRVAVIGYGRVGKSVARRARGLGAEVIVCEVDPFAAVEAFHGGFDVLPVEEACAAADIVLAATESSGALPPAAIERLRDGALLASCASGGALDIPALRERALETRGVRESVEELVLDEERSIFLVGGGLAVDLAAGEGPPVELVDLTCSVQALAARYLVRHGAELTPKVHLLPYAIDEGIALRKLETLGLEIDRLTEKQRVSRSG